MVHERDEKYEVQEDGEYHFSDDQASYETDTGATQVIVEPVDMKAKLIAFGTQYKRPLMGLGGFFVLIIIVYKILAPSNTPPNTDIAPAPAVTAAQPSGSKSVSAAPLATASNPSSAVPPVTAPAVAPSLMGAPVATSVPQEVASPAVTVVPVTSAEQAAPVTTTVTTTVNPQAQAQPQTADASVSQKMSDYEVQASAMQGKLQDMSLRLASMETALTRLGQLIQELKTTRNTNAYAPRMMAKPFVPKMTYTVQAIIPGRAWLKSETGDTVTVTEGDTLQGYGRVLKIDPYDGVVQIDVGGKIISLSYGSGNE